MLYIVIFFSSIYCIYEQRDIGQPKVVQEKFLQMIQNDFVIENIPNSRLHPEYQSDDIKVLKFNRKWKLH